MHALSELVIMKNENEYKETSKYSNFEFSQLREDKTSMKLVQLIHHNAFHTCFQSK